MVERFQGNILSSDAVLTEVLYLLNFSPRAQSAAIDFVLNEAIALVPSSLESLKRVRRLMDKYKDIRWIMQMPHWYRLLKNSLSRMWLVLTRKTLAYTDYHQTILCPPTHKRALRCSYKTLARIKYRKS